MCCYIALMVIIKYSQNLHTYIYIYIYIYIYNKGLNYSLIVQNVIF
ncbi:hypothetical protein K7X86_00430 [Candidatus Sulcia muelleri]|nr:hypothetical protein [Candidatus Karelsulcia muelleri]